MVVLDKLKVFLLFIIIICYNLFDSFKWAEKPTFIINLGGVLLQKVLEDLKQKLSVALEKSEIIVDDVTYEHNGKYNFLTVTLDKVGGIDLETIVDATHIVNEVVDKMNITDDSYILDVVSKERG